MAKSKYGKTKNPYAREQWEKQKKLRNKSKTTVWIDGKPIVQTHHQIDSN